MTKQQLLQSELRPGEALLWSEEPDALAFLTGERGFMLFFGVAWLSIVGLMSMSEEKSSPDWFFSLFGLIIVAGPLWELAKSFFTLYGITDSRLLIVRRYPWAHEVESFIDRDIRFLRKTRRKFGRSSVVFTSVSYEGSRGRVHHRDIGFFGIDDVDLVEALIEKHFRYRELGTLSAASDFNTSR
ncbi:MAG: hypothetical protein HYV96_11665 [Opitutae bacterium]|nr:hypothetical protein [Opitutae bacterium]